MQYEQGFSSLIYDYLLMRIRFQSFKYGDYLPSIDTLCLEFSVADRTVKTALRRMRDEGYISMHNGRPTQVVFQQTQEERDQFIRHFFGERCSALSDLGQTLELIFVPMLAEGFVLLEKDNSPALSILTKQAGADDLIRFYNCLLQKLNNPLIMNLFWEIVLFQGYPLLQTEDTCLYDINLAHKCLKELTACRKAQTRKPLSHSMLSFQRATIGNAANYIKQWDPPLPAEKQIPFSWRIYRDRPQFCYSLASRILYEAYLGEYRSARFLPSYEKMAAKYCVSVSTIRRTVHLLSQLGVVDSVNGKGTRIFSIGERSRRPDLTNPAIRRNMAYFFQAFEIVLYSCEETTRLVLSSLSPEGRGMLTRQLKEYLRTGQGELALWTLLSCFAARAPLHGIREIYTKVYSFFLWGYPLKASGGEFLELERAIREFAESIIQHLEENAIDRCAADVKKFVAKEFPLTEKYLLKAGLRPEELRFSSSLQFLLTDA